MREWKRKFFFKGKEFYYNRIKFNNPTERAVEIPIALDFLANIQKNGRVLEVGNVLSNYENQLSETLGINSRRIVDKFEVEPGVENEDLMNLPSDEKYNAIVSLSTVEHIGQKGDPSGEYGEQIDTRDLEAPLKAIAKIYDLLNPDGKALITVPFGKLIDGEWYIQFSKEYLYLLSKKYGIPKDAISINYLKLIDRESTERDFNMCWEELDALELSYVEYGSPFSQANAIAIIEISKLSMDFHLQLNVEPSPLSYNMQYDNRVEFEKNKALLEQTQSELKQTQAELDETQSKLQEIEFELEYSKTILCDNQSKLEKKIDHEKQLQTELEQSQSQLYETQSELEQSQAQLYQTQTELEQSQAQLYETQTELEQSQAQLCETQTELEQSQSQLCETQTELEQSQSQLYETQTELEQSQAQLYETQAQLQQALSERVNLQRELAQGQEILHETQSKLEQYQVKLSETQSELQGVLKQFQHQQLQGANPEQHQQTTYTLFLWEAWYAYQIGDLKKMANFLEKSWKCTPFSKTETIINWLDHFAQFSSEKGEAFDTMRLSKSKEWQELTRRLVRLY